jgi:hypothetical protein
MGHFRIHIGSEAVFGSLDRLPEIDRLLVREGKADEIDTAICTRSFKGMLTQKVKYPMTSSTARSLWTRRQRRHVD